jgi:hypothetical protein
MDRVLFQWKTGYEFRGVRTKKHDVLSSIIEGVKHGEGKAALALRQVTGIGGAVYKYGRVLNTSGLRIARTFGYEDVDENDLDQVFTNLELLMHEEGSEQRDYGEGDLLMEKHGIREY